MPTGVWAGMMCVVPHSACCPCTTKHEGHRKVARSHVQMAGCATTVCRGASHMPCSWLEADGMRMKLR
jgi:hypothetical protein